MKPQNVLVMNDPGRTCKLSDFGVSRSIKTPLVPGGKGSSSQLSTRVGTVAYMPPECLRTLGLTEVNNQATADIVSGEKWDVYSLAVLFSFIFTEHHPFGDMRNNQIVRGVVLQVCVCVCVCVRLWCVCNVV